MAPRPIIPPRARGITHIFASRGTEHIESLAGIPYLHRNVFSTIRRVPMSFVSRILALTFLLTCSSTAQNWVRQNLPQCDSVFCGMAFSSVDTGFVVGTDGIMFRTTDAGATWEQRASGTTFKLTAIEFVTRNVGVVVGENGTILRTLNGGESWYALDAKTKSTFFTLHFFDEDSGFVAGQGGELLYTTDKGQTWTSRDGGFGGNNIYSMSFPTAKVGFICGNAGNVSRTLNGGRTWQSQDSKFKFALMGISFGSPTIGTMVGTGGTIRHTKDAGRTWTTQDANVPISSYSLNAVQHIDSTQAYIAGWLGMVLYKQEKDAWWTAIDNPYSVSLDCIHFFNKRVGYVGGWTFTILKTTNGGGLATDAPVPPQPAVPILSQNAPNPVRLSGSPVTQLRFEIARQARTTIRVYNMLGMEVATVLDEELSPGRYIRNWSVPSLPNGAYHYVLRSGTTTVSRVLTLVR
jgi:photosystem II stability/assembly factor-like uncharacterized protein